MGAGAVAAAAAHQRQLQEIVDAFRLADATSVDRARTLAELNVTHERLIEELAGQGVLVPGRRSGTWYLSEAGYIARRDRFGGRRKALIMVLAVIVAMLAVAAVILSKHAPS